jgi:transcriptional regulator with XRE-family HTH domain
VSWRTSYVSTLEYFTKAAGWISRDVPLDRSSRAMMRGMFGEQIRAAREKAGLSRATLSALAEVARSNLQTLEQSGNVTVGTLAKVLPHLPDLRWLTIGGVDFMVVDEATKAALADLVSGAERLEQLIGTFRNAPPSLPAGATLHSWSQLDDATWRRVAAIDAEIDRGELDPDRDS